MEVFVCAIKGRITLPLRSTVCVGCVRASWRWALAFTFTWIARHPDISPVHAWAAHVREARGGSARVCEQGPNHLTLAIQSVYWMRASIVGFGCKAGFGRAMRQHDTTAGH